MSEHGTASIRGAYLELQTAVLKALPRNISDAIALQVAGRGERLTGALERAIADVLLDEGEAGYIASAPSVAIYPSVGEVFDLTLDGGLLENQPLEMVRQDGYSGKWKHAGSIVGGTETRRFRLVQVGYCCTFDEVVRKLVEYGKIPEGQWRQAFKAIYPKPDGNGPIGVADSSWVDPCGCAFFPDVSTDGGSDFYWTDYVFYDYWRWLVEVSK